MKICVLLFVLFCAVNAVQADENFCSNIDIDFQELIHEESFSSINSSTDILRNSAGAALLCFELIGVPILQKHIFWNRPLSSFTSFKVDEKEPYLMDKAMHFLGGAVMTELNYYLLKESFGLEDPILAAGAASLTFWTIMECCDGFASVGFSARDQIGNTLGVLFGMLRLKNPSFPVYVRAGVEDMKRTMQWAQSGFSLKKFGTDYYSMTKAEMIYIFDNNLYVGAALSKGIGKKNYSDRFGVTFGYDLLNGIEKKGDGVLYKILGLGQKYASISISVTYWNR